MKIIVLVISMVIILGGCASAKGIIGNLPRIENDNFATIHIARKSGICGCTGPFSNFNIQINRVNFYGLPCGERISFKVPGGEEISISQTTSHISDHVKIFPEKGRHYYVGTDCVFGGVCWFSQISSEEYREIAATCGREIELK